ncbi:MAG: NFACT RNA binding domain-containing protein [Lachnospiraceae bacterium]|nr:NFACT RNA binding domain-containing protein [Lachnospiraceae bacterium]
MAFDGITVACLRRELAEALTDGKIAKITQPENDELLLTIKNNKNNYRLLLSANASLPLAYLTDTNKPAPLTAPNFCMLLRKRIGNGRIVSVTQPGLERILVFRIEHRNELGDLCTWKLIVELMGKHSNIIFCNEEEMIIDSIKHVSANMSSVREVLPGRTYFIPKTQEKADPLTITEQEFYDKVCTRPMPLAKAVYTALTGFSPLMGEELCHRASLDGGFSAESLDEVSRLHFYQTFARMMTELNQSPACRIYYDGAGPVEFSPLELTQYETSRSVEFDTVSSMLETYFAERSLVTRIRQKSTDLRKIVSTNLERAGKKLILQEKQMKDTEKKDKYRIYGELLNTYGYSLTGGEKSMTAVNYYTNEEVTIPLDPTLTAGENAKKYFDRYNKLKRTAEALEVQIAETKADVEHLESISTSLDISLHEEDLLEIREELTQFGYLKAKGPQGKKRIARNSAPLHYRSCDGFDIYVGKNNFQNELVSFKLGSGNDWWFHAKGMPGSHVLVKCGGAEMSDQAFEEAGRLAAFYSKGRQAPKVEIDYTQKKNLRKPGGGKPGFVVYYTNYSLMAEPDITGIEEV